MLSNIIDILNLRLKTTGYFSNVYGICELKDIDGVTRPLMYLSNGEYKNISDFDQDNGSSYWRLNGRMSITDGISNVSNAKMLKITTPLKLVACVLRERMTVDNSYNNEIFARSLFSILDTNLKGELKNSIGSTNILFNLKSIELNDREIFKTEFAGSNKKSLAPKFVFVSLEIDLIVDINQSCILNECSTSNACDNLIKAIPLDKRINCILPSYDFSSTQVQDALTDQQIGDIVSAFCTNSGNATVQNSDETYSEVIPCGSTLLLPDQTINVYLDGVLQYSFTNPSITDNTINIVWQ